MEISVTFLRLGNKNRVNDNLERETYRINVLPGQTTGDAIDNFKKKNFREHAGRYCIVGYDINPKK